MKYKAFHKLSYGLYIIASESNGERAGYIGNTAFQVTSQPPQIAVSCHKDNHTLSVIQKSGIFSLSVLKKESETSLIGEFGFMSSSELDKFQNKEIITASTGAPIVLNSSLAWLDCKVVNQVDVGSHVVLIAEVLDSDVLSGEEPLTYDYYREKYKMLAPKNAPTYLEKEKIEEESEPEMIIKKESEKPSESTRSMGSGIHTCAICGFQYNEAEGDSSAGIPPGTAFEDLPDDYKCPICNAGKDYFKET